MNINRFSGSFANRNQQTVNVSGKKNWAKIMSSQQNQQDIASPLPSHNRLSSATGVLGRCGEQHHVTFGLLNCHKHQDLAPNLPTLSDFFCKKQKAQNQLISFYFQHSRLLLDLIWTKDKTCTFHKMSKEKKPRGPRPNIALRKKEERPAALKSFSTQKKLVNARKLDKPHQFW